MPWLNRLWRSRIGNIPQPRKGRHGHSTQPPGRVSRVDCGRFLPISFMPRSRNKTTSAGGQIGGFFPGVRSGGGGRARENGFRTRRSLGVGEAGGSVKPREGSNCTEPHTHGRTHGHTRTHGRTHRHTHTRAHTRAHAHTAVQSFMTVKLNIRSVLGGTVPVGFVVPVFPRDHVATGGSWGKGPGTLCSISATSWKSIIISK